MTIPELDRLVSKTELTPATKAALRVVRKSVMKGRCEGPQLSRYSWSVVVEDVVGGGARFTFNLRKTDGDDNHATA